MTEAQMREVVSATFAAAWRTQRPDVPLWLENEAQPTADVFASLTITPTTGQQTTMGRVGTRRVRRNVWLQVKIWSAQNVGSVELAKLGDVAQGILEMTSFPSPVAGDEPLTTQAANAMLGPSRQGKWFVATQRVPGWFAEIK